MEVIQFRKKLAANITKPIVQLIARTKLTPNSLSIIGFLLTAATGILIGLGHLFAAGWVMLGAGVFDMLDGALARLTNTSTKFGAALDSTLDRFSEALVLLGIMTFYAQNNSWPAVLLAGTTLVSSFMVSYIRARAEGLSLELKEGIFTRAERVIVLALGLLLSHFYISLIAAMAIISVLSFITAGQRLYLVWKKTKS
jgi:CDP-diacylglycerol---glycerol-3-phosphate 3-phosphatidyltransferase